jgi:hypothetical protein
LKADAIEALQKLKGWKLLNGYRGARKYDVDAFAALVGQISDFVCAERDHVLELDINPVFVHTEGEGAEIVDAMIITGE